MGGKSIIDTNSILAHFYEQFGQIYTQYLKYTQMTNQVTTLNSLLENFLALGGNNEDKMQASRNLSAFSQNEDFIDIAMTLLTSYQLSENKILLLSIMIKDKFKYDFELIDYEKIMSYYQVLCEFASKFGTRYRPLFSNISQSLAFIYINQITQRDLSLSDFLQKFQTSDQNEIVLYNYYFKILEQCAEAVINSRVVIDDQSRRAAKKRLIDQQFKVINILNQSVETVWYDPTVSPVVSKNRIINCFTSWIELHYDLQIYNSLPNTSLLQQIVACLRSQSAQTESAVQCVKALIQQIQSPQKNSQLYQYLGSALHQLIPYIDARIAKGQLEDVQELISLVVFFSQKFAHILVKSYSESTKNFLMSLIKYMNTGQEKIVDILIDFWQEMLDLFVSAKQQRKLSPDLKMDLPIALLHVLTQICTYPPEMMRMLEAIFEHKLGSHNQEADQIYRNRVAAQLCYASLSELLGVNCYIDYLLQNVSELDLQQPTFFSSLESYLYALIPALKKLQAVTQSVLVIVQTYQHLKNNINSLPTGVKRTFLRIFKAIFSIKITDPNLASKLYYFIIEHLPDTLLVESAARAFSVGCEQNPDLLYCYISEISGVFKSHPLQDQIIRGYISLASYDKHSANFVISDCLEYLLSYAEDDFLDVFRSKQYIHSLYTALKAIKDCSFDEKKELLQNFVKNAWGFILKSLKNPQNYTQDEDVKIERIVKLLKSIMRIVKTDFIPYLSQLFTTVNEYFAKYPICSYVYLVEIAVTVYSTQQDELMQNFLKQVYQSFTESAFKHLQTPQSIDRYCYLMDDFLGMNSRLLIYNTNIIVSSSLFPDLIRFITEDCLQTTSEKSIKATYSFLQTLFMIYWSQQFVEAYKNDEDGDKEDHVSIQPIITDESLYIYLSEYLKKELPGLLKRMLQHLAGIPNEHTKNQILDTLLTSIKAFTDVNPQIWKAILSEITPNILLQAQKQQIVFLLQSVRQQSKDSPRIKTWMKQLNSFLNLIFKRMQIADKRRRMNMKE